jgi:3-oxoacyl-[acyl-carrier protein] reductase
MNKPITLITGTRKGIGKYLAEHYVAKGHQVIGCSRSEINWELPCYEHFITDVADEEVVKKLFSIIRKQYGRLDNLINNAGIASMNHVMLTPLNAVCDILKTNVVGTFLFSREAVKLMMKNKKGRIVNFTTVASPLKLEGEAIYAASKSAVNSLTEIMAREFSEFGVTVNGIGPTPIDTDLVRAVPQDKMKKLIERQAIKRMGKPADVANVIDFYLQRESDFITGQTIYLGGI